MLNRRSKPAKDHIMPTDPKPKLAAQIIPVFRVRYRDLENYILRVFGIEFDLLFATGCTNGMCPEYQVGSQQSLTTGRQANDLRRGQRTRNLQLILEVLFADGYIPAGRYIIDTKAIKKPESKISEQE